MATTSSTTTSLAVLTLIFAMAGSSAASYCVCKGGGDAMMQKALDYACGNGADCTAIRPNGACYNPNSLQSHCSYAVNNYYQKKSSTGATCDFEGEATLSSAPPTGMCTSSGGGGGGGSLSAPGSSTSPSMSTPTAPGSSSSSSSSSTTTPVNPISSTTPTSGSSPYMTPGTGTGTGTGTGMGTGSPSVLGTGLAPTGVGMNDESHATTGLSSSLPMLFAFAVLSCSLAFLWS